MVQINLFTKQVPCYCGMCWGSTVDQREKKPDLEGESGLRYSPSGIQNSPYETHFYPTYIFL